MKTVYLRVEVPNDAELGIVDVYYRVSDKYDITITSGVTNSVTEIQLPTEEEIEEMALYLYKNGGDTFQDDTILMANWLLNKIKQGKQSLTIQDYPARWCWNAELHL